MDPETKAKLEEELNILEKEVINKEVKWDEDVKKLKTITKQLKQLNDNSDFDNAPSLSKKQRKSCKHLLLKCKIVFMQQSKDVFSILKDYLVNGMILGLELNYQLILLLLDKLLEMLLVPEDMMKN